MISCEAFTRANTINTIDPRFETDTVLLDIPILYTTVYF